MPHPKRPSRRRRIRGEQGYILIVTALLIVPLVVFTGFGVDLGSWYAQAAKQQRAVDAASLAGVVQLPSQSNATTAALASLKANGYVFTSCGTGTTVNAGTPCAFSFPSSTGQEMTVTLYQPANIYFAGAAGLHSQSLTRSATAVYNLHIPLGSPTNTFGNDPTRSGSQPSLWGAINGPYSNHEDGDPYATKCAGENKTATSCDTVDSKGVTVTNPNAQYNPDGYLWGIDIPAGDAGSNVTVSIYDPAFGPTSDLNENYSGANTGFSTSYQLFKSTGSYADIETTQNLGMNSVANGPTGGTQGLNLCTGGTLGYKVFPAGTTSQDAWYALCTFAVPAAWAGGIYPLQVKTSAIPGVTDIGTGYNAYSVKAVASVASPQPSVYGLNNLSIWTPSATTSRFYLASIGPQYAGHTLVVDLYDPGDGNSGNYYMQFLAPPSGSPAYVPSTGTAVGCYYSAPAATIGGQPASTYSSTCNIQTRSGNTNIYNERWLRVQITIPTTATTHCTNGPPADTTDCWWTIKYTFGGTPTDRTVWVVNVLGDPVHLIQ